LMKFESLIA